MKAKIIKGETRKCGACKKIYFSFSKVCTICGSPETEVSGTLYSNFGTVRALTKLKNKVKKGR
jgi:uncharacterized OB-fold protein